MFRVQLKRSLNGDTCSLQLVFSTSSRGRNSSTKFELSAESTSQ